MSGQHKTKNSPTQSGCTSLKSVSRSLKFTQAELNSVPAFQQEGPISFSLFGMLPVPKVAPTAVAMGRDKQNL